LNEKYVFILEKAREIFSYSPLIEVDYLNSITWLTVFILNAYF